MNASNINSVFYAKSYHPIQAGSIDGTDILPHDHAVYRAHFCSSAGLYDPFGDSKVIGDPYCTIFVGRLNRLTTEDTLRKAMSKYGRVKSLRLVRDIVTGASRGYAFVEFESEREMRRAYADAHHTFIDDSEIIVDYNRQQLMPGWIPRRLGGGLGGKKESGQLRFGGRERPFRAPLRPIPYDELKRLGIPPPPEGRYMPRHQIPSPPRRNKSSADQEHSSHRRYGEEHSLRRSSRERGEHSHDRSKSSAGSRKRDSEERSYKRSSRERGKHSYERESVDPGRQARKNSLMESEEDCCQEVSMDRENFSHDSSMDREDSPQNRIYLERERGQHVTDSGYREERSKRRKHSHRSSTDGRDHSYRHHEHRGSKSHRHKS